MMLHLWATLSVVKTKFLDTLDDEEGGITLEAVSWAVGVIVIIGIVIGVVTNFVEAESAKIQSPND